MEEQTQAWIKEAKKARNVFTDLAKKHKLEEFDEFDGKKEDMSISGSSFWRYYRSMDCFYKGKVLDAVLMVSAHGVSLELSYDGVRFGMTKTAIDFERILLEILKN